MQVDFETEKPIFVQIADGIEDAIVTGAFPEESRIPSITDFSVRYKINPATALKGISILVENGTIYKKRGVGMFVSKGAKERLTKKRRDAFYEHYIKNMLAEDVRLGIKKEEIIDMLKGE